MTNEEKKDYIDLNALSPSSMRFSEIVRSSRVFSKRKDIFYKYKKCDDYTFDSIKKGYLYLSPARELDDPFDCLIQTDLPNSEEELLNEFLEYLINKKKPKFNDQRYAKYINQKERQILSNSEPDFDCDNIDIVSNKDITVYLNILRNAANTFHDYNQFCSYELGQKNITEMRVGSLTTSNTNKNLWSLYGDKYSGICIEYKFPRTLSSFRKLLPVLYSNDESNNYKSRYFDMLISLIEYNVSDNIKANNLLTQNIGSLYYLISTKDECWSYQDEWRVVSKNIKEYKDLKITSIYMGFAINPKDEVKLKGYSKKYKFKLFKMEAPSGSKEIRFKEI